MSKWNTFDTAPTNQWIITVVAGYLPVVIKIDRMDKNKYATGLCDCNYFKLEDEEYSPTHWRPMIKLPAPLVI